MQSSREVYVERRNICLHTYVPTGHLSVKLFGFICHILRVCVRACVCKYMCIYIYIERDLLNNKNAKQGNYFKLNLYRELL